MKTVRSKRSIISLAAAAVVAGGAMPSALWAQSVPAPAAAASAPAAEAAGQQIVVTGVRATLAKSLELKRDAIGTRDSILAEDIGKFPEQNIADALQRIPGVEVIKDPATNEGQRVQLRGLPSEYTVTLFNGAPVRATSGGNIGSATRDFNYDIFPSELFSRVDVYKTPEAFLEEGGAAGVVDLRTPRPFDFKGRKITYSVASTQNKSNGSNNPRGQLLFSDTWGNFGVLAQGSLTKASQGTAGAQSTGHFADSRDGTSLLAAQPAGVSPGGRQFNYDMFTNSPLAKLGTNTEAQVKSAFLPRLMRSVSTESERERLGFNTSLQYKDSRWNVSLDSVVARLQTENKSNTASFNIRDSTCGRFVTVTGVPAPVAPNRICGDATTRNGNTGSFNNALIPLGVGIDANNMLSGTLGNVTYGTVSNWQLSRTKFDYHGLNVEFKATDALSLTAQLSANKSVAWRSQTTLSADNNFADGVIPSTTSTSGFTLAPGVINRHRITFDLSNPLFPSIASNLNLLDPKLHTSFSNSGGSYVTETDKQNIVKLGATYDYELMGMQGRLKGGLSVVDSTKRVDQLSPPNLLNGLTLPNGKLFTAATLNERAEYMRTFLVKNEIGNVAPQAGNGFPKEFLVFDMDTIKNTLNALATNKAAPLNQPSSFNTVEKVSAAFAQTDLEAEVFGRPLRGNVGVRHVKTSVEIDNYQPIGGGAFAPANRVAEYDHTLPSVSLAYDVVRDVVVRASAGKTFKRSSVSAISRTYGVRGNGGDLSVNAGNPDLVPEESSSRDWGVEWYFAKGGVLALAGYDKSFTGRLATVETVVPFKSLGLPQSLFTPNNFTLTDNPDTKVFLPKNVENFKIKGLELSYQQSFTFLPAPFNGLGAYGSYTKNTTLGVNRIWNGNTYSLPLVPKDTYSMAAYYEQGPLFLRVAYNHKSEWANPDTGPNQYGFQRINNARGYLDASVGYKISKALEVRVDGINLTNQKTYEFFRNFEGKFGDENSRIEGGSQAGRGIAISLRGSF